MINLEAKKIVNLSHCNRKTFLENITDLKEDRFANTFVAKADMGNYWNECVGVYEDKNLLGAIILTVSKKEPKIANLQLLHTFFKHRKKGVAAYLCQFALKKALYEKSSYFRVSSKPEAVNFYKKIGFTMLGKQKSGTQLSMFRIVDSNFKNGLYDITDPVINACVYRKGRGGCIEIF